MFTQITNPSVMAYDAATGKFWGEARFDLTEEAERSLLNRINYGVPLGPLVMLNSDFEPSSDYIPIIPNRTYHQNGIFYALLTDGDSGERVPVEMRVTYDWRTRSTEPGTYLSSVEFNNMQIHDIRTVRY